MFKVIPLSVFPRIIREGTLCEFCLLPAIVGSDLLFVDQQTGAVCLPPVAEKRISSFAPEAADCSLSLLHPSICHKGIIINETRSRQTSEFISNMHMSYSILRDIYTYIDLCMVA